MKKNVLILTTLVFTLITVAGVSPAFSGHHGKRNGCGDGPGYNGNGPMKRWEAMLPGWADLSRDQKNQIKALHQKLIDDTADSRISIISKQEQMRILAGTSSPDRERLVSLAGEISDLKKEIMTHRIDFVLEAKKTAPELKIPLRFHGMDNRGAWGKPGHGNVHHPRGKMSRPGCPGQGTAWKECPAAQSSAPDDNA